MMTSPMPFVLSVINELLRTVLTLDLILAGLRQLLSIMSLQVVFHISDRVGFDGAAAYFAVLADISVVLLLYMSGIHDTDPSLAATILRLTILIAISSRFVLMLGVYSREHLTADRALVGSLLTRVRPVVVHFQVMLHQKIFVAECELAHDGSTQRIQFS